MKCSSCNEPLSLNRKRKCPNCSLIFCSHSCLYTHISKSHKKKPDNPYLQCGEYLKKFPTIDPSFSYSNFECVLGPDNGKHIIGKGAFGALYLARNKTTKKVYAIKHMNKQEVIASGATLDIIQREISIQIRINHPNIVKLYSYYEDEYNFYLVMEYVPNGTLFQVIQRNKGLTEKTAFKYFYQVACAIYFLHSNNLAHRDIKPENILIGDNDQVKLCDFGWCVDVSKGERATFCGTIEYMAPEIINDKSYDCSTDIWSLGVLLYEMTHGYSPFSVREKVDNTAKAIFDNINNLNYAIYKNLSEECKDLLHRMLDIDSRSRIKIKEIFEHPWIKKNENEMRGICVNNSNEIKKEEINEDNNEMMNTKEESDINNNSFKDNNITKAKTTKEISKSNNDEISNKKIKISNNKKYDDDDDLDVAASLFEPKKDDYFDSILNNIQVNNTSKKKKKNTLAKSDLIRKRSCSKAENRTLLGMPKENAKINIDDLDISESEEFAFLNDLNHTRCTSKKTIDHSKMLNMNFLPKDLLYNESNYKESTQSILKTIDLVEKAQILHEEKIKGNVTKKKDSNKENKKGFWEDLFSTFKCGQCTSNN